MGRRKHPSESKKRAFVKHVENHGLGDACEKFDLSPSSYYRYKKIYGSDVEKTQSKPVDTNHQKQDKQSIRTTVTELQQEIDLLKQDYDVAIQTFEDSIEDSGRVMQSVNQLNRDLSKQLSEKIKEVYNLQQVIIKMVIEKYS